MLFEIQGYFINELSFRDDFRGIVSYYEADKWLEKIRICYSRELLSLECDSKNDFLEKIRILSSDTRPPVTRKKPVLSAEEKREYAAVLNQNSGGIKFDCKTAKRLYFCDDCSEKITDYKSCQPLAKAATPERVEIKISETGRVILNQFKWLCNDCYQKGVKKYYESTINPYDPEQISYWVKKAEDEKK